jgi:hypothetical protein
MPRHSMIHQLLPLTYPMNMIKIIFFIQILVILSILSISFLLRLHHLLYCRSFCPSQLPKPRFLLTFESTLIFVCLMRSYCAFCG